MFSRTSISLLSELTWIPQNSYRIPAHASIQRHQLRMASQTAKSKPNTGARMPAIGLGTWQDADAQEPAVTIALKLGYCHIDTAHLRHGGRCWKSPQEFWYSTRSDIHYHQALEQQPSSWLCPEGTRCFSERPWGQLPRSLLDTLAFSVCTKWYNDVEGRGWQDPNGRYRLCRHP